MDPFFRFSRSPIAKHPVRNIFGHTGKNDHPLYIEVNQILYTSHMSILGSILLYSRVKDEIHKFVRWRNFVKGFYDTYESSVSFLIEAVPQFKNRGVEVGKRSRIMNF